MQHSGHVEANQKVVSKSFEKCANRNSWIWWENSYKLIQSETNYKKKIYTKNEKKAIKPQYSAHYGN